ncbi:MAG: hypothetical protein KC620_17165 [Myxococcales bacterium]|nr:hypothetical protein [Myxococcales bacterium]
MRTSLIALTLLAGCAGQPPPTPAVPPFVAQALTGAHGLRGKFYLTADGRFEKFVAYVERDAMPDWIHPLADEKLGAGEEVDFEVEQYADGARAYEVTRLVDGRKAELSVTPEQQIRYVEREVPLDALPAPVKQAVDAMAGVTIDHVEQKEGPGINAFEVIARDGERELRVVLSPEGGVVERASRLSAVLQIIMP